jgi:Holliday junction resolvase RusA-like endonuclease
VYTPATTVAYETAVAWYARASGLRLKPDDRVMVEIDFYLCPVTGDVDNRIKAAGDGLQRAYPGWDDRHVTYVSGRQIAVASKREQRTVVRVEVLT